MNDRAEDDIRQLREGVRRLGARFDETIFAATRSLYVEHVDPTPVAHEHRDQRYGDHERHRLDIFSAGGTDLPVVVFVHGGGFIGGDKNGEGGFYANVGRFFASRGYLAVTINYRLATTDGWPAGLQDVSAAVDWVVLNAGRFGGDGKRIGLVSQSAGSCHAAGYILDPQTAPQAARHLKAAVLMSGFYVAAAPLPTPHQAYFGTDASAYPSRSPLTHAGANTALPLLITVAELDPARLARQTLDFVAAVTDARGACPPLHWFTGHNHVSTLMSLRSAQVEVGEVICGFLDPLLTAPV